MGRTAVIELNDVHKSFGVQHVLRGVNLRVERGRITVIMGASGGGKSVLLKHMIGLIRPDRGEVNVYGGNLAAMSEWDMAPIRKRMGILFQDAALFDSMNVAQNVAFPLLQHTRLKPREVRRIVAEKLELVGLSGVEQKMPSHLSGGMRKRVGLARAIAMDPEILLFDEPTSGLDPVLADSIDRLIVRTQSRLHVTAVVISHDVQGTFRIADRVAMLAEGTIVAEGSPEAMKQSPIPVVQRFLQGRSE